MFMNVTASRVSMVADAAVDAGGISSIIERRFLFLLAHEVRQRSSWHTSRSRHFDTSNFTPSEELIHEGSTKLQSRRNIGDFQQQWFVHMVLQPTC